MRPIPLIRGRYLQAFVGALDRAGASPGPFLERHGIPEAVLTRPDAVHPAHQLWSFAADAARRTGIIDLGARAGRIGLEHHGGFGAQVVGSPTLRHALEAFCGEAEKEYSRATFRIATSGSTAWFCRDRIGGTPDERLQVELYVLEMMLQTIRLGAGPGWQPREMRLQSEERPGLRDAGALSPIAVRYGSATTAIPIPRRLLGAAVARGGNGRDRAPAPGPATPALATDFTGSLRQLLATYLADGPPRIQVVARAARCSVRTLQRHLHAAGLSYSRLVEDVRLSAAADNLREPGPKLVDIAFDAGYSDQANFTRAFRRWAGVPPSQFRRMSLQGAVGPPPQ
jgi:AraC-like DNA-binding protein